MVLKKLGSKVEINRKNNFQERRQSTVSAAHPGMGQIPTVRWTHQYFENNHDDNEHDDDDHDDDDKYKHYDPFKLPNCAVNNTITDGGVAPQCTFARPT